MKYINTILLMMVASTALCGELKNESGDSQFFNKAYNEGDETPKGKGSVSELPTLGSKIIKHDSFIKSEKIESFITEQSARIGDKYGSSQLSRKDNARQKELDYWQELAENELRGLAESSINEKASSFMSSFGTAEFNIGFSKNYSIAQFSSDILIPIEKTAESIRYVQVGVRNGSSGRGFFNVGGGERFFHDGFLLGVNTFLDYDYKRDHARASLGGEYFSDLITVSSNAYVPLTGWKSSPDVIDYLEKPSYGADIRVDGYLPWNPKIGLKGVGEYYSGNEVDILFNGTRVKNPYAITLGVNYTPIPLLTFAVNHTEAKNNQSATSVEAKLNWRIGSSWQEMIEPQKVANMRSLDSLAMGLVNRNNQIVLKYKKDESVLKVTLPDSLQVKEFDSFVLIPDVQGIHKSRQYVWSGDILKQVDNIYSSQLYVPRAPAYIKDNDNIYYISLLVTDSNKNVREASTRIRVIQDESIVPSMKLKDKYVKLRRGDVYSIDWSVIDPRNEDCKNGCDKTYEKNIVELIFPERVLHIGQNFDFTAIDLSGGDDIQVKITLPSGHIVEDTMKIEIDDSPRLREIDVMLIEETTGMLNAPIVNSITLKAKVLCNGSVCDQNVISKYNYLWMRKNAFSDSDWQDVLLTEDNTYTPTKGPNGGDQGYIFKVKLVEKSNA